MFTITSRVEASDAARIFQIFTTGVLQNTVSEYFDLLVALAACYKTDKT